MGKKQFCFFQTAETGNRTPDSGVKGSGANHYPRAPARQRQGETCYTTTDKLVTKSVSGQCRPSAYSVGPALDRYPSAGLRRIHTHQAGMSTATQQSQQKNARHWGGCGPMLAQRFQRWPGIGPPPLRGHSGNIPAIILCHQLAHLHNSTIQHVNNTRQDGNTTGTLN